MALVHSALIQKYLLAKVEKGDLYFDLTLEGLKLAAAIGTPRLMKADNQRPPRRTKNGLGPSSPHEYRTPSFRDEYSFTYTGA